MSLFALGDPHLSLASDKPMDVFRGWSDYVSRLEKNWNAVVKPCDTVVLAGDISWAMTLSEGKKDFAFLNALNGEKILLKGNHDYWWATKRKMDEFFEKEGFSSLRILHNNAYCVDGAALAGTRGWFFDDPESDAGKVIRREEGRLRTSLASASAFGAAETIAFLHYPPIFGDEKCELLVQALIDYGVKRCFFGHLHGAVAPENESFSADGIEYRLISADHLGFCPKRIFSSQSL